MMPMVVPIAVPNVTEMKPTSSEIRAP